MKQIRGLIPPAITVFDQYGHVDYGAMKEHADFMIDGGVDGIAYLGTSGEFGVMTQKQKLELINKMTAYVNGRVNVLIGIGDTCLENTLEMGLEAKQAGASGVLSLVPYFSIYGEENVEAYYDELAQRISLPIVIYNFPALTGFDVKADLVERLVKKNCNIVGIKDTVEDKEHLRSMLEIKKVKADFSVFCAYETQALEMKLAGIDGFINATANFAPEYTAQLLKAGEDQYKMEAAYHNMCRASEVYAYAAPLLLAVKEAVYQKVLGRCGYEKLPGLSLKTDAKTAIADIISSLG